MIKIAGTITVLVLAALTVSLHEPVMQNNDCGGLQAVELESDNPAIKCIGLIDEDLSFPRNLVNVHGDLWLVDKGSHLFDNGNADGVLYRYRNTGSAYIRETVLEGLVDPNDIAYRNDKHGQPWIYISTSSDVFRIRADVDQTDQIASTKQVLIQNIPTYGWHKLTAITLNQDSLWLTVPSATDHCELSATSASVDYPCREAEHLDPTKATALIRRYDFTKDDQLGDEFQIIARGLRDALAVSLIPGSKQLLAADNGWDQIDLAPYKLDWNAHPSDEINLIGEQQHFGWPYCYANNQITPVYTTHLQNCRAYTTPLLLLPAHSAPLSMIFHRRQLLINLHGPNLGQTVAYSLDQQGLPYDAHQTVIDWRYTCDIRRRGRPLGLGSDKDNNLYVTDDWNGLLMKVIFKQ